jgi:hypothetical protein
MSFDSHFCRFALAWLLRALESGGDETCEPPEMSPFAWDGELTNDLNDQDLDEALDLIASANYCVCPLCGALVRSDGSVVS